VRRADYLVIDRRRLAYLNIIEKCHCTYCEYGNGLMGYIRYQRLLAYGGAGAYEAKLDEFRVALGKAE
jgi:hypothetical protein